MHPDMIRRSTDQDMQAIRSWLEQECQQGQTNFLVNWSLTEERHQRGELIVYIDGASELPVGYQWGGLICPGILEVRPDMRGRGIGRKLVMRRIAQARRRNECLLVIQCKPSSSIPFWQKMGFTLRVGGKTEGLAYRILRKRNRRPAGAEPVDIRVCFYPEERKYSGDLIAPLHTPVTSAFRLPSGVIRLTERVFVFPILHPGADDAVIEITVAGQCLYLDKAKYSGAERLGVARCQHGFYIDEIRR
ncbi:MAG: GNAT family N-acetyltransferase [Chthoniobacteraceae bacterium]